MTNTLTCEFSFNTFGQRQFESRAALLQYTRALAFDHGFALSIARSKPDRKVWLACSRSGTYRKNSLVSEPRKKRSGTSKNDCPYLLIGLNSGGVWHLIVENARHNHKPDYEDRSCGRMRLGHEEKDAVVKMSKSGARPRHIYLTLKSNNERFCGNIRSIYNSINGQRTTYLAGREPNLAMFEEFEKKGYVYRVQTDDDNKLTHLYLAHPHSVALSNMFNSVFLLDCTYKTNRYGMPLLNVVGVTATNQTFTAFNCFMNTESAESYVWALRNFAKMLRENTDTLVFVTDRELGLMKAIKTVFPKAKNLLCTWHIEKNVLANCRSSFRTEQNFQEFFRRWSLLINAETVDDFDTRRGQLQSFCSSKKHVWNYLNATWLSLKEHFVKCFLVDTLHFGNFATSRVEGSHASMKKVLEVSTGDLPTVTAKLDTFYIRQFDYIASEFSKQRRIKKHVYEGTVLWDVAGKVSEYALKKAHDAYLSLGNACADYTDVNCRCSSRISYGLPCYHVISTAKHRNVQLSEHDFHDQWQIHNKNVEFSSPSSTLKEQFGRTLQRLKIMFETGDEQSQTELMNDMSKLCGIREVPKNPDVYIRRGTKHDSKPTSTKRALSFHEHVFKPRTTPKCSFCGHAGHNITSCPKRAREAVAVSSGSAGKVTIIRSLLIESALINFPCLDHRSCGRLCDY